MSDLPAYLCVVWLRTENMLVQHGRQGYSFSEGVEFVRLAEER